MGDQGGGEMSAGGRTHDADAFGVEFPFLGPGAHGADGAGGILQHRRMMIAAGGESIFQDEAGNALFVQPKRVALAFMLRETAVAATRANHDGRARGFGRVGQKDGERGDVFFRVAQGAGSAVGPEGEGIRGLSGQGQSGG